MRILIVTQAVDADSSTLGFFVEWLREFAKQCECVDVIALSVGRHDLPSNVRVVSMGKERGFSRPRRLFAYWRWLREFLPERDGTFIHMCPEYLIAGWPLFMSKRKPIVFWYAHRARNLLVRAAAWLATADVSPFHLVAVGRLTPIKRLELLIEATALLRKRGLDAVLELWGAPALPSDQAYETSLRDQARTLGISGQVRFLGGVPFGDMPKRYGGISVALNACPKGAIDKAVLEAMSCARPVVVTNDNFSSVLGPDAAACLAAATAADIADKLEALYAADRQAIGTRLRAAVVAHHGLPHLVEGALDLLRPRS